MLNLSTFLFFFAQISIRITDLSFSGPFSLNATITLASQQFFETSLLSQGSVKKIKSSGPENYLSDSFKCLRWQLGGFKGLK